MDLYTLVCQLTHTLQTEGKTPSLALVRARAGKGISPTALFSAYQQWRANPPEFTPLSAVTPLAQTCPTEMAAAAGFGQAIPDAPQQIQLQIKMLQQDILRLESKIDQLLQSVLPQGGN